MTGRMPGRVMCHSRRHRPAPSTAAASYWLWSIAARAARKMIAPNPASFQIACEVTSRMNVFGSVIQSRPSNPLARSTCEIRPAPPSICWKIAMTSTQEKKYGRYTTLWSIDRSRSDAMECMSRASAIGTGK
nr:hypothetical protein GCM10025732_26210 [Glycomyces mayteni]